LATGIQPFFWDGDPCTMHLAVVFWTIKICVAVLEIILILLKKLGLEFWTGDINLSVYAAI
jgi:hypothetical protein